MFVHALPSFFEGKMIYFPSLFATCSVEKSVQTKIDTSLKQFDDPQHNFALLE